MPDSAFEFKPATARSVLRLKSWAPPLSSSEEVHFDGRPLPSIVGAALGTSRRALCTAPQEWLLSFPPTNFARLRNVAAPELTGQSLALVDLTAGMTVLECSGTAAREVLSKGCGLDFDRRSFGAGRCARTRFAQIPVVIDCIQESGDFELYAARSYAQYLEDWLWDAAVEFG